MRAFLLVALGLVCGASTSAIPLRRAGRRGVPRRTSVAERLEAAERDIQEHKARLAAAWGVRSCSFCSKPAHRVALLIALPDVAICDGCVEVCQRKVHRELRRLAAEVAE